MASHYFSAPRARLASATPRHGSEVPLNIGAIRAKLIIITAFVALAAIVTACGGRASTKVATLHALSTQVGCLATTNAEDLGFVQSEDCWFTPLPDHPITTEEMLQLSASTQAKLNAMKIVSLTVYTGSVGDLSAEEITNEKFQALVNRDESCDRPTYYVRGSNWFTDPISDIELARHIAATSHGEFGSRQCGLK